jgi:hypothetical protein
MFWVLKRFELVLLVQSIVMIIAQLTMLELIVRVRGNNLPSSSVELPQYINSNNNSNNSISNNNAISHSNNNSNNNSAISILDDAFWDWSNLKNYVTMIVSIFLLMANVVLLNLVFTDSPAITELIGYCAMGLESTLAMPQLYRNHVNKSCAGLSLELVAAWVC